MKAVAEEELGRGAMAAPTSVKNFSDRPQGPAHPLGARLSVRESVRPYERGTP